MTTEALKDIRPLPAPKVPLSVRIALRELRGGLKGFYVFIACIALGVASIAAVGVLAGALTDGLVRQGQELLGADVSARLIHRQATAEERAFLTAQGRMSETATLRALVRQVKGTETALARVKAVDAAYPLYGEVRIGEDVSFRNALAPMGTAIVEPLLLERLGLAVQDKIKIGNAEVRISGILAHEPDRLAGGAAFGPRVLMSIETLKTTGLVQPGSLIRWRYNIRLPDSQSAAAPDFKTFRERLDERFPQSGFSVRDRRDPTPGVKRIILRFAMFLTLVGLTALLI
ncbi:MAG: ABC transporter permease, partial [Methyloligellaceae bacterium]